MSSLWKVSLFWVIFVVLSCFNDIHNQYTKNDERTFSWFPRSETRTDVYQNLQDRSLFAFMMRDANRMVGIDPPFGIHVFDYINVYGESFAASGNQVHLYLNGHDVGKAPCEEYSIKCYKDKMLQIFHYVANHTQSQHLFYMEADNTLCVPLTELERIAKRHSRHFIGTGIGASGWIMSRSFLSDFITRYESGIDNDDRPDVVASKLLMTDQTHRKGWAVTRQYLVAHTLMQPIGGQGLTIGKPSQSKKRLPRCFEPHRGMWVNEPKLRLQNDAKEDKYGWDYFDFDACPGSDIYPCTPPVENQMSARGAVMNTNKIEKSTTNAGAINSGSAGTTDTGTANADADADTGAGTSPANAGTADPLIPPSAPAQPEKASRINHATQAARYFQTNEWPGPFYVQNSELSSISDIWKEYKYGWNGSKSIWELELLHKGWRSYKAGENAFNRRKTIWATIEKLMSENGGSLTELQAIQMVQQKLDVFPRKGQSKDPDLNGFNRHLKDEEFGGGGFELEVHKLRREQASAGSSTVDERGGDQLR